MGGSSPPAFIKSSMLTPAKEKHNRVSKHNKWKHSSFYLGYHSPSWSFNSHPQYLIPEQFVGGGRVGADVAADRVEEVVADVVGEAESAADVVSVEAWRFRPTPSPTPSAIASTAMTAKAAIQSRERRHVYFWAVGGLEASYGASL